MVEEENYAAKGVSFECRCEAASNMLKGFWSSLQSMFDDDLRNLQEIDQTNTARKQQSTNTALHEFLDKSAAARKKLLTDSSQKLVKTAWEETLKTCRKLCGNDATDFALSIFDRESKKN